MGPTLTRHDQWTRLHPRTRIVSAGGRCVLRPVRRHKVSFIDLDFKEWDDRDIIAAEVRVLLAGGYDAFSYSDFDKWARR